MNLPLLINQTFLLEDLQEPYLLPCICFYQILFDRIEMSQDLKNLPRIINLVISPLEEEGVRNHPELEVLAYLLLSCVLNCLQSEDFVYQFKPGVN